MLQVSKFKLICKNLKRLKHELQEIKTRQNKTAFQLDELEHYGRRENLELHGIPTKPNKNTNKIVKHVASLLKVQQVESHISIFHRLPKTKTLRQ